MSAGDVRRPYPTEIDMRSSLLAKFSELPGSSQTLQTAGGYADINRGHPGAVLGLIRRLFTFCCSLSAMSLLSGVLCNRRILSVLKIS